MDVPGGRRADPHPVLIAQSRSGPATSNDLDFMVQPKDAERALEALGRADMRTEKPPEGWLYKAWDGDVLVDIIFEPVGEHVDDAMFARAEELEVNAVPMLVMSIEDVMVLKLKALDEHDLTTNGSPFASAFFALVEELGIVPTTG